MNSSQKIIFISGCVLLSLFLFLKFLSQPIENSFQHLLTQSKTQQHSSAKVEFMEEDSIIPKGCDTFDSIADFIPSQNVPTGECEPVFPDETASSDVNAGCNNEVISIDSASGERVLLLGDSQLEGLRAPVYDYCLANGHRLISSVLWYGSSTKWWGTCDTLEYYINKFRPNKILIALGLNELFVRDLDNRKKYIENILSTIKKHNLSYYWIGPAAWTKDSGITNLLKELNGDCFFPSHLLKLPRASDRRHPSKAGARIWFDSVASVLTKNKILNLERKIAPVAKIKNSSLVVLSQIKKS